MGAVVIMLMLVKHFTMTVPMGVRLVSGGLPQAPGRIGQPEPAQQPGRRLAAHRLDFHKPGQRGTQVDAKKA